MKHILDGCCDDNDQPLVTDADFCWEICYRCHGDGVLGGFPGAYTESDRAEWSDDDYDEYVTTTRCCEDCSGTGKVRMLTDEAEARPEVQEALQAHWDTENTYRMERMMGA